MKKIFAITCLILVTLGLQAQTVKKTPKLVVGIVIDQLRTDYLEMFSPMFGEGGFKRLWNEGQVYRNGTFDFDNIDGSSATAAVYSGTSPYVNGIIGNQWMDRSSLRVIGCVDDTKQKGWYTTEGTSAQRFQVTTLTDELKVATGGKAYVCAIAPERDMAVLSAGHAADVAVWKNDLTPYWCGTEYYGVCPTWITTYNKLRTSPTSNLFHSWEPLNSADTYGDYGFSSEALGFSYTFNDKNGFRPYKTSACINDEIFLLSQYCLQQSEIGKDNVPDFLALSYYAGNYQHQSFAEAPLEIQDIYVRLDRNIATLLEELDKKVGLENLVIFVTSTGYTNAVKRNNEQYRLPAGKIVLERVSALLNMYLGAFYGKGEYVETCHNTEIYLNKKLIEQMQLNMQEVIAKAADFLVQVSGVEDVFSVLELNGVMTPQAQRVRNGFNRSCSGDISLQILPGWSIAGQIDEEVCWSPNHSVQFPIMFFGVDIPHKIINEPVSVNCIAPTVSRLLHLERPNGSKGIALDF